MGCKLLALRGILGSEPGRLEMFGEASECCGEGLLLYQTHDLRQHGQVLLLFT